MLDLRQTSEYAKYLEKIDWKVEKLKSGYAYIKKVPFIGNLIKIQRPQTLNYNKIRNLITEYKPFQIIIEPKNQYQVSSIKYHGFKQSRSYFLPSKTIYIDLTKSEKQLLKEMHHKTRYNIGLGKRSKVKVESSKDILVFADFWNKCALKQRGMFINQKKEMTELYKAFSKNAYIIMVFCHPEFISGSKNKESPKQVRDDKLILLAGVLVICTKEIAYYMFAASTYEGKKLFAPTLAAWEAIKLAKKMKCRIFDFEGIYDDRFPLKSWLGFTRFKKSFGGKEIEYPGTYTKFLLPFRLW